MKTLAWSLMLGALTLAGCDASTAEDDTDGTPQPGAVVKQGDLYPDLTVRDCEGNAFNIREYLAEHDVSYVTFGAKWCTACQEEAPVINSQLVDGLADKNVGVIQVLVEGSPGAPPAQSLCSAWSSELNARFAVIVDPEQVHLEPFFGGAISTLPLHLVVTGDAKIRLYKPGAIPADIKSIVAGWLP